MLFPFFRKKPKIDLTGFDKRGSIVQFGSFPLEVVTPTPIRWIVLEADSDMQTATLLSTHALLYMPFDLDARDGRASTWGNSTLRKWLNDDEAGGFIALAFNEAEQQRLHMSDDVEPDRAPNAYARDYGEATRDQVYLLSRKEVEQYFPSEKDKRCLPGPFAQAQERKPGLNPPYCDWWLRTPGSVLCKMMGVQGGSVNGTGLYANSWNVAVRPVIRVWLGN